MGASRRFGLIVEQEVNSDVFAYCFSKSLNFKKFLPDASLSNKRIAESPRFFRHAPQIACVHKSLRMQPAFQQAHGAWFKIATKIRR
jgi:hypothetical protein